MLIQHSHEPQVLRFLLSVIIPGTACHPDSSHWRATLIGCIGRIDQGPRRSERSLPFSQPIEPHLELADLLVELGEQRRVGLVLLAGGPLEEGGLASQGLLFHWVICTGWTPNSLASWLKVFCPLQASRAT